MSSQPCRTCLSFLASDQSKAKDDSNTCCPVCLGLFNGDAFQSRLEAAIRKAAEPYGGCSNNKFSTLKDNLLVVVPGDVVYRYSLASRLGPFQRTATRLDKFVAHVKQATNNLISSCLQKFAQEQKNNSNQRQFPDCVEQEEQGYLAFNVVLATPASLPRPSKLFEANKKSKKSRRKPFQTQGGHPRTTLEQRLECHDATAPLWPLNQAVEQASKNPQETDWFATSDEIKPILVGNPLEIHVALWRRPFIVQGRYTKTRRDVSQTPFFVEENKKRKRLGTTSIEELILPALTELSGGISALNNSSQNHNVVYGMAKFHASGREDMDVRMILPTWLSDETKKITGRPFCCEIIDALRMPTEEDLNTMAQTINHNTGEDELELLPKSNQYYGQSPMGVGVDPDHLTFAPGSAFKNLQSETEEKHKFYGCLCWSEKTLPPLEELIRLLTKQEDGQSLFPIELKQRTPLRVLHRRANAVRLRHILSCHHVERLDNHYFRIHISTDAGTYVKEFVHGDLGRTQPNVSTLLKTCGKTDILEFDCEGIQLN